MKRQDTDWEKIFAKKYIQKILMSRYGKKSPNSTVRKPATQLKSGQKT